LDEEMWRKGALIDDGLDCRAPVFFSESKDARLARPQLSHRAPHLPAIGARAEKREV
jgi:hypothetical protein